MSPSGPARWVGQTLDERYRVDRLLGEGGMGSVFVAQHLRLDKPVALKIILPEHAGNADLASRFAREAMLTAKIEHPHVVSAIDTGSLPGGGAYLVMQLAKGRSLRELVVPSTGWARACEIGAQIADALVAAHAMGIVHRDLKPENVMVEERDGHLHCRVLDFGIARSTEAAQAENQKPLTRIGTILGTPGYMPPEQGLGDVVDHRADLYAVGVIVWELAAGRGLFTGKDPREIALAQLTEPVPVLPGEVPPELMDLLDALLAPKKEDRPSTASEVRERLRRIALGASLPGRGSGASASSSGAFGAAGDAPALTPPSTVDGDGPSTAPGAGLSVSGGDAPATSPGGPPVAQVVGSVVRPPMTTGGAPSGARRRLVPIVVGVGALALVGAFCAVDPLGLAAGPYDDVPAPLRADLETVLVGADATSRTGAAARVGAARDTAPPFAGHVADLELARDCDTRRDAIRHLRDDADPRALPALQRVEATPRDGCGRRRTDDCNACLRRDLAETITALGGTPAGDAETAPTKRGHDDDEAEDDEPEEPVEAEEPPEDPPPRRGRGRRRH